MSFGLSRKVDRSSYAKDPMAGPDVWSPGTLRSIAAVSSCGRFVSAVVTCRPRGLARCRLNKPAQTRSYEFSLIPVGCCWLRRNNMIGMA